MTAKTVLFLTSSRASEISNKLLIFVSFCLYASFAFTISQINIQNEVEQTSFKICRWLQNVFASSVLIPFGYVAKRLKQSMAFENKMMLK